MYTYCNTYCKLKNGEIFVLWSDNVDEETVDLISLDQLNDLGKYDPESFYLEHFQYSEIDKTDTNLAYLQLVA